MDPRRLAFGIPAMRVREGRIPEPTAGERLPSSEARDFTMGRFPEESRFQIIFYILLGYGPPTNCLAFPARRSTKKEERCPSTP